MLENREKSFDEGLMENNETPENVILGVVGALIGAVLGMAVIALIGMAGYVASIGGVALAFFTLMGYKLLAKKLSFKGVVISVILMVVSVFAIKHLEWAVDVYTELRNYDSSVRFSGIYINILSLIRDSGFTGEFLKELIVLYIFTAIGAVPTIRKNYFDRQDESRPSNTTVA